MTEHWVVLGKRSHTTLDCGDVNTHLISHNLLTSKIVGNELVERWIEQADVNRTTVHSLEDTLEVGLLIRQQLGKCLLATLNSLRKNHLAHSDNLLVLEEHVLCTCKTDTLGTKVTSHLCIVGCISVGANLQLGIFVAEVHQFLEVAAELSCLCGNFACIYLSGSTIQRDVIAFLIYNTVDLNCLSLVVNIDATGTRYAALTHTTSHNGSVRGHTSTGCQDTLGRSHTGEVLGRSLDTYHDHLVTISMPCLCIVSVEHNLTASSTRRSRQTLSDDLSLLQGELVEYWVEKFVELLRLTTQDSSLLVDHSLVEKVDGNLHHSSTRTLSVTSLEEPQFALLYGEFHILHVMVVLFEFVLKIVKLCIYFGHSLFHRRILGCALFFADSCALCPALRSNLCNLLWCTNTSHNVLTLCINKVLTVEQVLAITGITAEAYTSSRGVAHITEYHCHDADGCTPLVGNTLHLAVDDGTLVHPAAEHSADSTPKLLDWVVGEILTCALLDSSLEQCDKLLELIHRQILVKLHATLCLHLLDNLLERVDVFLVHRLHLEHHVAVHLNETAIRVINEVGVVGLSHKSLCHFVVKTEVEDCVHHTRH